MDTVNFHESEDSLELYALRRLPDSEVERVENHLLVCSACREQLEEVSVFAYSMRESLKDKNAMEREAGWFAWLRPGLGVAGVLATILIAAGLYWASGATHVVPVASMQLTALRGSEIPTVGQARELDLSFTDAPASARLDVVDASGATVWTGTLQHGAGEAEAKIAERLSPGEYFARVYLGSGQLLHEYQFRVAK